VYVTPSRFVDRTLDVRHTRDDDDVRATYATRPCVRVHVQREPSSLSSAVAAIVRAGFSSGHLSSAVPLTPVARHHSACHTILCLCTASSECLSRFAAAAVVVRHRTTDSSSTHTHTHTHASTCGVCECVCDKNTRPLRLYTVTYIYIYIYCVYSRSLLAPIAHRRHTLYIYIT